MNETLKTRGHWNFNEEYTTTATASTFCAFPKWAVRDPKTGRFATQTHEAMVDLYWNDEREVAHSHTSCPSAVGTLTAATGSDLGWLCTTCVGVSTPDRRFYLVASKSGEQVCTSCGEAKPATKYPTLNGQAGRSTECRECRTARRAKR